MPSSAASEDTLETADAEINLARIQEAVHLLLRGIGEEVGREGLRETPKVRGHSTITCSLAFCWA